MNGSEDFQTVISLKPFGDVIENINIQEELFYELYPTTHEWTIDKYQSTCPYGKGVWFVYIFTTIYRDKHQTVQ